MSDIVYTYVEPTMYHPDSKIWTAETGKQFEESYCEHCEVISIQCPVCRLGSCSGSSCDYCKDAFQEYFNGR